MKERTMEAIAFCEEYFVAVIEKEAGNNVVPSRTEELCSAACGLKAIAGIKFKQMLKNEIHGGRMTAVEAAGTVAPASTILLKHRA